MEVSANMRHTVCRYNRKLKVVTTLKGEPWMLQKCVYEKAEMLQLRTVSLYGLNERIGNEP